jgi:hypothetical protein
MHLNMHQVKNRGATQLITRVQSLATMPTTLRMLLHPLPELPELPGRDQENTFHPCQHFVRHTTSLAICYPFTDKQSIRHRLISLQMYGYAEPLRWDCAHAP